MPIPIYLLTVVIDGNTGPFTGTISQVVEFGPTDFSPLLDHDFFHMGGVKRENPLHADTTGDLSNPKMPFQSIALFDRNAHSLEYLNTALIPFPNADMDGHGIPSAKGGKLFDFSTILIGVVFFDYID